MNDLPLIDVTESHDVILYTSQMGDFHVCERVPTDSEIRGYLRVANLQTDLDAREC